MQCTISHQTLSIYIDGELPEKEKRLVEKHLEACESCREVLERLRVVWALIDMPVPDPSPFMATKVLTRLKADSKVKAHAWLDRLWVPAVTLAVMVLGFFLGGTIESNGNGKTTGTEETVASVYAEQFADFPEYSIGQMYSELVMDNQEAIR